MLDTGVMLQIKAAHAVFVRDLRAIGRELYRLAETYKDTPMAGRTHAVQALPITFGHKCAVWLAETGRNHQRLTQLEERVFVGSLVGAVGTQASLGDQAFELDKRVMARLGLGVADISWQPARDRLVEYVGVLGLVGGSLAKIANEIITLAHTEVGELGEPFNEGKVGSSTMPHKRNPSTCEGIVAVGRTLRYTVALMHEALIQEHERDASAWRFEWKALPEACLMTGAILAQMKDVLVKTLRGGKMEDVIFAGTSTRGPLGRAEVTLTIDNSDGALPIEYSEVTISRTLFRNGGSRVRDQRRELPAARRAGTAERLRSWPGDARHRRSGQARQRAARQPGRAPRLHRRGRGHPEAPPPQGEDASQA